MEAATKIKPATQWKMTAAFGDPKNSRNMVTLL